MTNHSPVPKSVTDIQMDFPSAIIKLTQGKKINRISWNDKQWYGVLNNGKVQIHKPDGKLDNWTINEGDLLGTDWIMID